MKNLLYTAILVIFCSCAAFAQASFQITANPLAVTAPPDQPDTEAHSYVTNLTPSVLHLKWERVSVQVPAGMHTQICDPNLCWLPTVSTKTFNLPAGQQGDLIVHFINEVLQPMDAIVHITVTNLDNPSEVVTGVYTYSSLVTGTHDQSNVPSVKIFPNPTADRFSLDNATGVSAIRVFALDGRQVAYFNTTADNSYSLDGQAAGTYVLSLEGKNGHIIQAAEIHKN